MAYVPERALRWAQLEFRTVWEALDGYALSVVASHDPTLLRLPNHRLVPWITPKEYTHARLASKSRG
jgi:hypothetical protein